MLLLPVVERRFRRRRCVGVGGGAVVVYGPRLSLVPWSFTRRLLVVLRREHFAYGLVVGFQETARLWTREESAWKKQLAEAQEQYLAERDRVSVQVVLKTLRLFSIFLLRLDVLYWCGRRELSGPS